MKFLKIQTERLTIQNLVETDLQGFYTYRSNSEVTKYQGFDVMNELECKTFIKSQLKLPFGKPGQWIQYGIEQKSTQKIIGDCAIQLQKHDPRIAEIGITISHLQQKKGFAKEAMLSILAFLFEEKNLHRVVETVDTENTASINLLESVGFKQEGHFIENIYFKGKWGSEFQYAMLKREWDRFNAQYKTDE